MCNRITEQCASFCYLGLMCTDISPTVCAFWALTTWIPFCYRLQWLSGLWPELDSWVANPHMLTVLRIGLSQIVHLIFKRTETRHPFWVFVLLFAIPACLTLLYMPHAQRSTILATVKVFTLFWSTLTTSILVYRVSPWHPLAKYPGPLICKLTKFHLALFAVGGSSISTTLNCTGNTATLFELVSRACFIY